MFPEDEGELCAEVSGIPYQGNVDGISSEQLLVREVLTLQSTVQLSRNMVVDEDEGLREDTF